MKRVMLAGASGLVGGFILRQMVATGRFEIIVPARRALGFSDPCVRIFSGNWNDPDRAHELIGQLHDVPMDSFVCALGTTLKDAGSKEAFRAVDFDLVVRLGKMARDLGARHAILVSSVGADPKSANFYLMVKGKAEQALRELGFERIDLLRPSLLLGPRTQHRQAEALGRWLMPLINPFLLGGLKRYRGISAEAVASSAVALLAQDTPGCFVHEHTELRK